MTWTYFLIRRSYFGDFCAKKLERQSRELEWESKKNEPKWIFVKMRMSEILAFKCTTWGPNSPSWNTESVSNDPSEERKTGNVETQRAPEGSDTKGVGIWMNAVSSNISFGMLPVFIVSRTRKLAPCSPCFSN